MTADSLKLYTWGYSGRTQADLFDLMTEHQLALVVDVRQKPWSRDAQWRKAALTATFGTNYRHLPDMGNRTRSLRNTELVNQARGLGQLEKLLHSHRRVLIVCLEKDHSRCHRSFVAARMQEQIEDLEVIHL